MYKSWEFFLLLTYLAFDTIILMVIDEGFRFEFDLGFGMWDMIGG